MSRPSTRSTALRSEWQVGVTKADDLKSLGTIGQAILDYKNELGDSHFKHGNSVLCCGQNRYFHWCTVLWSGIQLQLSHVESERKSVQQALLIFTRHADGS